MSRLVVIALLAACAHHDPAPAKPAEPPVAHTDPAVPDPAPCEGVTETILRFRSQTIPADLVREIVLRHCKVDTWSLEHRKCVITANSDPELAACERFLTLPQREAYRVDVESHKGITVGHPAPTSGAPPTASVPPAAGARP